MKCRRYSKVSTGMSRLSISSPVETTATVFAWQLIQKPANRKMATHRGIQFTPTL